MYIRNTYLTLKVSTNSTSTLSPLTLIEIKAPPENKEMTNSHLRNQGPLMEASNIIKVVAVFFSDVASAEKKKH